MAEGDHPSRIGNPGPERQAYYDHIATHHMAPLWESLHLLVPPQPLTSVLPARWDYDNEIRPLLMEAGQLITAKEAERRVLMLQNPGLGGQAAITSSLYAGLQLILPGEIAPAHRHTQSALRFIMEGDGAYTAINGEQTYMRPGDLVLTPSWNWHDHGNETDKPMVWMDGLDIPLVSYFGVGFMEPANAERRPITRPPGDSDMRYGSNLAPVDWKPAAKASPVFSYPYARTREVLDAMARNSDPDPCHGHKMRYVNPASGGHVMPTIGAFVQRLERGMTTAAYRCTDATVYAVVRGPGPPGSATRPSPGSRGTSSWSRAGIPRSTAPTPRPCCSATPTVRSRKPSGSGASSAPTPEPTCPPSHPAAPPAAAHPYFTREP